MAALVVAALAQVGDRPAWLAAILADRHRPAPVIAAAALAFAAAAALAAIAGTLLAPLLTPEAARLFLALALGLQGGGALFRVQSPERLDRWRLGGGATALIGLFIQFFGDGVQFVVLALSASPGPGWLAATGATLGALPVIAAAALMGEQAWCGLPQRPLRLVIAALFLLAAAILALNALRLV